MGPGVDPHQFKPSARDVAALRGARIIFYNGAHLEGKLQEVLERMASQGTRTVALVAAVPQERLVKPEGFEGQFDPHIWFDPELWAMTPALVAETLGEAMPEHAATFAANAQQLSEEIRLAGEEARRRLEAVPAERRVLVTSHDAFHYFGRAFAFEVAAPQGISTLAEAGIADVSELSTWIRERQIPAIFVESSVSPAIITRISQDSGARVGGELFSDAMGAPGEMREANGEAFDTGTYTGMFLYNASTIAAALRP
jgi:manganese/zinc/iron transport system substrate-binding protein